MCPHPYTHTQPTPPHSRQARMEISFSGNVTNRESKDQALADSCSLSKHSADCGRGSWRSRFHRLPLPSDPAVRSVANNRELIFEVH